MQFSAYFTNFSENDKIEKYYFLYKLLMNKKVADTFPNVEIIHGNKVFWRTFIQ